jgi:phosphoenolpyruvate-protein kinase (PTS system EI component)
VVEAATLHHTPVGICGELAGNREALMLLLGLGLSELSVSPALIPEIKSQVRETNLHEVRSMAEETTRLGRVTEIRSMWLPS